MTKTINKYYCDRCGCEMEDPNTIEIKNPYGRPFAIKRLTSEWEYLDLCPKCKDEFVHWWIKGKEKE